MSLRAGLSLLAATRCRRRAQLFAPAGRFHARQRGRKIIRADRWNASPRRHRATEKISRFLFGRHPERPRFHQRAEGSPAQPKRVSQPASLQAFSVVAESINKKITYISTRFSS